MKKCKLMDCGITDEMLAVSCCVKISKEFEEQFNLHLVKFSGNNFIKDECNLSSNKIMDYGITDRMFTK